MIYKPKLARPAGKGALENEALVVEKPGRATKQKDPMAALKESLKK